MQLPPEPVKRSTVALAEPPPAPVRTSAPVPAGDIYWHRDVTNGLRKFALYLALLLVFVRFGMIHEWLQYRFHTETHLLEVIGAPCIALMVWSGGLRRTLQHRAPYYWLALGAWMVLAIPFSSWKGGSFGVVVGYLETSLVMLFVMAGVVMTWKECVQVLYAMFLGGAVSVLMAGTLDVRSTDTRLSIVLPSFGNANDLAAHLLLILPFILFPVLAARRHWLVRWCAGVLLCFGAYDVFRTGSRGALIAVAVTALFILFRAPGRIRIGALLLLPATALIVLSWLPQATLTRYATLFDDQANLEDESARMSAVQRNYLFQTSALFSIQHPLLGVGPGEFEDVEANYAKENRRHATWLPPHNSYLQISSEAGIPALIFMLAALGSSFGMLNRTYKQVRGVKGFETITLATFCTLVSMVAFCSVIFFLSLAYHFYLPTLSGIALALSRAAPVEFANAAAQRARA